MALIVQKYGGTSVADAEKIKNVARRIAQAKDAGNQVVVVASAEVVVGAVAVGVVVLPHPAMTRPMPMTPMVETVRYIW